MAFFSTELLQDLHGLSEPICGIGLGVGVLLYLLSFGPVMRLSMSGTHSHWAERVERFYSPIPWLHE